MERDGQRFPDAGRCAGNPDSAILEVHRIVSLLRFQPWQHTGRIAGRPSLPWTRLSSSVKRFASRLPPDEQMLSFYLIHVIPVLVLPIASQYPITAVTC
jgi:hypothetical protein